MKPKAKPIAKPKAVPVTEEPLANTAELIHRLAFSQDNVMSAAAEQPVLFFQAAEYRIAIYRKYQSAKQEFGTVKAAVSLSIRQEFADKGEKTTEGAIEARTLLDENVNIAQHALQEAEAEEEASKLMLEAYRMRRDSLKVMMEWRGADLRAQQAQEFGSAAFNETRSNLERRYPKGL